ncbi:MAG TPA: hypothetical protein VF942_09080 [Acidimicrobiales bacterium]
MGKASSSKKVARAASTGGGRTSRGRTPWGFYLTIAAIVVLGIGGVYSSRSHRLQKIVTAGKSPPVANKDHWHVAYGMYVCDSADKGHFLPPVTTTTDPVGIHTHGDSVIHTHPFTDAAAGKNATLGKFASTVGMTLNSGEFKVPSFAASKGNPAYVSHDYRDGDSCGGKPGRVQVQIFNSPTDVVGHLWTGDPRNVRLRNGEMLSVAFVPKGEKIPPPPAQAIYNLQHLNDVPSTSTSSTPTTLTPVTPAPSASTTAPATSTTAPSTTAPSTSTTAKK